MEQKTNLLFTADPISVPNDLYIPGTNVIDNLQAFYDHTLLPDTYH